MTVQTAVGEKLHPYHCQDGDQDAGPASNHASIWKHHGGDHVEGNSSYENDCSEELSGDCHHEQNAQDDCTGEQKLECSCIHHHCFKETVDQFAHNNVSDDCLDHRGLPFSCTTVL